MKYLLLITVFLACNTTSQVKEYAECITKLKIELEKDWKFLPDSGYYSSKSIYSLEQKYYECIIKMDSAEVLYVFGKPTKVLTQPTNNYHFFIEYAIKRGVFEFYMDSLSNVRTAFIKEYAAPLKPRY